MTKEERQTVLDELFGLEQERDIIARKLQEAEDAISDDMDEEERFLAERRVDNIREEAENIDARIRQILGH